MIKKYNVIYTDNPWSYENKKTGWTDGDQPEGSGAATKYDTMTNEDLIKMGKLISTITDKNCICFMWVTTPLMPEGFDTLKAWGFQYKTMITWRKIMSLGMGYWFRGQTEHLLLGVKGNVKAFRQQTANYHESMFVEWPDFDIDQCFQSKAGKHSQKPHYFRELINKAVPISFAEPVKLEMFARSREGFFPDDEYKGWDVWGNQVNNSIELPKQ
jgi:site-specific DNA-methyltransferase (adenine-specific)